MNDSSRRQGESAHPSEFVTSNPVINCYSIKFFFQETRQLFGMIGIQVQFYIQMINKTFYHIVCSVTYYLVIYYNI